MPTAFKGKQGFGGEVDQDFLEKRKREREQAENRNSKIYASSDDEELGMRAREADLRKVLESRRKKDDEQEEKEKKEKAEKKKEEKERRAKAEAAGECDAFVAGVDLSEGESEDEKKKEDDDDKVGSKRKKERDGEKKESKKRKKEDKKKKKKSEKKKKKSKSKKKKHSSSSSAASSKPNSNSASRSASPEPFPPPPAAAEADPNQVQTEEDFAFKKTVTIAIDEDDIEAGPAAPANANQVVGEASEHIYGGALRPGEGTAMAQFVQEGKRIPRRGEVGLKSHEIEAYEGEGFVMSGSRHKRMESVRIRKENQVYSAEEKRALAMFNFEERQQRENTILAEFKTMMAGKFADAARK